MIARLESDRQSLLNHSTGVGALVVVIVVRWWTYLSAAEALGDEGIYLRAFQAAAEGSGLGRIDGFYYPTTFAVFGSWLVEGLGEPATRILLRAASVLGLAVAVWIAVGLWPGRWAARVTLAAVYVCIAPAVTYGFETGNITFAVTGCVLLALAVWSLRPVVAGLLLGASVAIKPVAPLAILALTAHRPLPATRRHLAAGPIGGALAAALILASPGYLTTAPTAIDRLPFIRSISLNRILVLLGLEVPPVVVAGVLALLVIAVVRWMPMDRRTLLAFGGLAAVVAVPVIWSHTLLLTLPLQVLALHRAVRRRQDGAESVSRSEFQRPGRRYELVFVVLAGLSLQLTEGAGAIDDQALWFELPVLLGFYLAAPALMAYVLATGDRARTMDRSR